MPFPSTFSTFTRPAATDRLNNPSHSALENSQSSTIGQIEAIIGRSGDNSVLGTIIGDLRSPNSGGGGHVQTANKGGTGQTSFTKGDLLVATSSSVISKLAVSSTIGEVLIADSGQAAGVRWSAAIANKITVSNSVVNLARASLTTLQPWFATSILGSTLGVNNAIKFTGTLPKIRVNSATSILVMVQYGSNTVASLIHTANTTNVSSAMGTIEGMIIADNSSVLQQGYVKLHADSNKSDLGNLIYAFGYGNSSINTNTTQNLIIRGQYSTEDIPGSVLTGLFVVEKIV